MEFRYRIVVTDKLGRKHLCCKVCDFGQAVRKLNYYRMMCPKKQYAIEMYFGG